MAALSSSPTDFWKTQFLLNFDRFSWKNYGKRRPNKFLAKVVQDDRKITIKCPWNSYKNQQENHSFFVKRGLNYSTWILQLKGVAALLSSLEKETQFLLNFDRFSWTNYGKRRPNNFLAKVAQDNRKITIKCPWNSYKNQQENLFLFFCKKRLKSLWWCKDQKSSLKGNFQCSTWYFSTFL